MLVGATKLTKEGNIEGPNFRIFESGAIRTNGNLCLVVLMRLLLTIGLSAFKAQMV